MNERRRRRPALRHLAREAFEIIRPPDPPLLRALIDAAPPGNGHTVLLLPSALSRDSQTAPLRDFLGIIGYEAQGWGLGWNLGPLRWHMSRIEDRLDALFNRAGPVSVIGFSMGGLFARWLAQRAPQKIRRVITVCSPVIQPTRSVWLPLDPFLGLWPGVDLRGLADLIGQPPAMPAACLYSRTDGIVVWENCRDPSLAPDDVIEVTGCHVSMARNPEVFRILAEQLSRP